MKNKVLAWQSLEDKAEISSVGLKIFNLDFYKQLIHICITAEPYHLITWMWFI